MPEVALLAPTTTTTITTTTTTPSASAAERLPLTKLLDQAQRLQQAGQAAQAAALYADWIAQGPAPLRHVASFNRGTLLSSLGRNAEAEAAYRLALADQPDFCHAQLNLGHLLERAGDSDAALAQWQAVIAAPHSSAELRQHALNNSGRLLETLRRFPQAEAALVQSLRANAEQPDVVQHYVHLRQKQCAWPAHAVVGDLTPCQLLTGTSLLATMSFCASPG